MIQEKPIQDKPVRQQHAWFTFMNLAMEAVALVPTITA